MAHTHHAVLQRSTGATTHSDKPVTRAHAYRRRWWGTTARPAVAVAARGGARLAVVCSTCCMRHHEKRMRKQLRACACNRPRPLRIALPLPASCSAASFYISKKHMQRPVAAAAASAAPQPPPLALQQASRSVQACRRSPSRIAHAARQQHIAMPTMQRRLPPPSRRACQCAPASLRRKYALGVTCTCSE